MLSRRILFKHLERYFVACIFSNVHIPKLHAIAFSTQPRSRNNPAISTISSVSFLVFRFPIPKLNQILTYAHSHTYTHSYKYKAAHTHKDVGIICGKLYDLHGWHGLNKREREGTRPRTDIVSRFLPASLNLPEMMLSIIVYQLRQKNHHACVIWIIYFNFCWPLAPMLSLYSTVKWVVEGLSLLNSLLNCTERVQ